MKKHPNIETETDEEGYLYVTRLKNSYNEIMYPNDMVYYYLYNREAGGWEYANGMFCDWTISLDYIEQYLEIINVEEDTYTAEPSLSKDRAMFLLVDFYNKNEEFFKKNNINLNILD